MHRIIFALIVLHAAMVSCNIIPDERKVIGVKIYDHNGELGDLFEQWDRLGINLALVSPRLAAQEDFMEQAKANNIRIFLIIPTFYNPEAIENDSSLLAITQSGLPASEDWVRFICPNRTDYREAHLEYLRTLTMGLQPDGISIDFIRYFVYWEKVYPDQAYTDLPQSCFDDYCLGKFREDYGITLPDSCSYAASRAEYILSHHESDWTAFKCRTISEYVREMVETIRQTKPGIEINFHAVPWRSDDFGGAVRGIAGQDLPMIAPYVDYISPMCYAHMLKRSPGWINKVVLDMGRQVPGKPLLPSIQVERAYLDLPLDDQTFRETLHESLKPPSMGVVLWSWEALERSPGKLHIFKEFTSTL